MLITDRITATQGIRTQHVAGSFPDRVLEKIERALPSKCENTVETGCGKSTILFSNLSDHHTVFTLDDREHGDESSVTFFMNSPITCFDPIEIVYGPTQKTMAVYDKHRNYDVIMIDGPHAYPFPEMEYYYLVPHLKNGGFLIIDDVHIPSIGLMADVLKEDAMFEIHTLIETTLILRRTDAPLLNPLGDGWEEQNYNRRRFKNANLDYQHIPLNDEREMRSMQEILENNIPYEGFLRSIDLDDLRRGGSTRSQRSVSRSSKTARLLSSTGDSVIRNWFYKTYDAQLYVDVGNRTFYLSLSNIAENFRKFFRVR